MTDLIITRYKDLYTLYKQGKLSARAIESFYQDHREVLTQYLSNNNLM